MPEFPRDHRGSAPARRDDVAAANLFLVHADRIFADRIFAEHGIDEVEVRAILARTRARLAADPAPGVSLPVPCDLSIFLDAALDESLDQERAQ